MSEFQRPADGTLIAIRQHILVTFHGITQTSLRPPNCACRGSGVNVHKFLSMLQINDIVTIQSKTNYSLSQEWKLNAAPVPYDNFMEFSVTLANSTSAQLPPTENTHVLFIFVYSGNALTNANATEARIAALEERVTSLTARLAAAGIMNP